MLMTWRILPEEVRETEHSYQYLSYHDARLALTFKVQFRVGRDWDVCLAYLTTCDHSVSHIHAAANQLLTWSVGARSSTPVLDIGRASSERTLAPASLGRIAVYTLCFLIRSPVEERLNEVLVQHIIACLLDTDPDGQPFLVCVGLAVV